jgi:acetylornithine deacetylase
LLVAEPTLCTPIHGHKGVVRLEFQIQGKATHSAQPHLGQNAVVAAAQLVMALQAEHERLQTLPAAALGQAFLTVTILQGGTGINVVPDHCRLALDRRVVNTESAATVVSNIRQLVQQQCPLPWQMKVQKELDAFYQPADSPWIQQLVAWSGQQPEVAPYGTNAWAYAEVAKERVVFGPGSIDQAHGAEEWVEIAELEKAAALYAQWWGIQ